MHKTIIVLVGEIGSGKGTVADYLQKKYHATYHRFSKMLKDVAERLYIPVSRDVLIRISEIFRKNFGEDIMARVIAKDVESDPHEIVVVDGARRLADIEHLSKLQGFHLLYITASLETRFYRIKNRGEKTDEQNLSFEQFKKDNERSTELSIKDVAEKSEHTIINDQDVNALYTKIDQWMKNVY